MIESTAPEGTEVAAHLRKMIPRIRGAASLTIDGKITKVVGIMAEAQLPVAAIGDLCQIMTSRGVLPAEVVGFSGGRALLMPLGDLRGVAAGTTVIARGNAPRAAVGDALLGRVIDGFGNPLDGRDPPITQTTRDLQSEPLRPLERAPVKTPLFLGIRAIDALLTCGEGQRLGVLAAPGVGKTRLLLMIAQRVASDVLVMAMVGERGREVAEFVNEFKRSAGFSRTVIVAATSDRPPLERIRAAMLATSVAEHFRDEGKRVVLVMDSLTRVAMAQREVGLAVGEPPTTKGYPPSVFAKLPRLLERAGAAARGGSITGIYTVLMEGDDFSDPIADAAIAILDGQVVLSRHLAGMGHFPAIDVLRSVSRVMPSVSDSEHQELARSLRRHLATLAEGDDLINIGAYEAGKNARLDAALAIRDDLERFLRQREDEFTPPAELFRWLGGLTGGSEEGGVR